MMPAPVSNTDSREHLRRGLEIAFDITEIELAEAAASGASLVLYIEGQEAAADVVDLIPEYALPNVHFFVPHILVMRKIHDRLTEAGHADQLLNYWTIDPLEDNPLYTEARELARTMVEELRAAEADHMPAPPRYVTHATELALEVGLHDRIASHIRPLSVFAQHADVWRDKEVVLVARRGYGLAGLLKALGNIVGYEPRVSLELAPEAWATRVRRGLAMPAQAVTSKVALWPFYDQPVIPPGQDPVVIITNLRDQGYRKTATEVIGRLVHDVPVVAFSINAADADEVDIPRDPNAQVLAKNAPPPRPQTIRLSGDEVDMITTAVAAFGDAARARDGWVGDCALLLQALLLAQLGRLLVTTAELARELEPVVATARCVAVMPARPVEGQLALRLAAAHGVPTIEVQCGTLQASKRFIEPTADWLLAIDRNSKDIFCEFLGRHEGSVDIIGSPKIDYDLAPYRRMTKAAARRQLDLPLHDEDAEVILNATQPIGVDRASRIMRMVVEAVATRPRAHLVVKAHPNEGPEYVEAYTEIASRSGLDRFSIVRDVPANELVVAADVVITLYSTVGLEAFALRRPVIVANPFPERPPFDLLRLGVAQEAAGAAELAQLLDDASAVFHAAVAAEPTLAFLQDGQSAARIAAWVQKVSGPIRPGRLPTPPRRGPGRHR